jgi:hypothetical protein
MGVEGVDYLLAVTPDRLAGETLSRMPVAHPQGNPMLNNNLTKHFNRIGKFCKISKLPDCSNFQHLPGYPSLRRLSER